MANFKPFDMKQKVLITGAAGFIGFHLANAAFDQGSDGHGLRQSQ